jgi:glycosyltransferase involved in cell wall biosynthesis
VPPSKLVFIPNASDLDLFRPDSVDQSFRARMGLEDKFVALYTGAMGKANGLAQLVDAARDLQAAGQDGVALVCVGDGAERPRQEKRAANLGLRNVLFLDPVPKHRLAGLVGAADVVLTLFANYPVLQTNSPNKFFDSLAAGRPAVVNLDGWLRRLVEENAAGIYVPAGDGAALAATLTALAREPQAVAHMGANARALAEREFDRDVMADRLIAALEATVSEATGAAGDRAGEAADSRASAESREPATTSGAAGGRDCLLVDRMEESV